MSSWRGQSRSWELTWAADDDDMTRARADDHAEVLVRMEFKAATVMSLAWQRAARRRQADCIVLCDAWEFAGKYLANTALVCDFSLSSSAAHFSSQDPVRPRQAVGLSQRSRNLLHAGLNMRCCVQKTVADCFAVLRHLHSIGRSVPTSV